MMLTSFHIVKWCNKQSYIWKSQNCQIWGLFCNLKRILYTFLMCMVQTSDSKPTIQQGLLKIRFMGFTHTHTQMHTHSPGHLMLNCIKVTEQLKSWNPFLKQREKSWKQSGKEKRSMEVKSETWKLEENAMPKFLSLSSRFPSKDSGLSKPGGQKGECSDGLYPLPFNSNPESALHTCGCVLAERHPLLHTFSQNPHFSSAPYRCCLWNEGSWALELRGQEPHGPAVWGGSGSVLVKSADGGSQHTWDTNSKRKRKWSKSCFFW